MNPSLALHPLPSVQGEERFAIHLGDTYAGGVTVHSIDPAHGIFSYGIAIPRALRRRGIAREAIMQLLARYAAQGFARCAVEIYADNAASLALHTALRFAETNRFIKDGRETVRMERML